MIPDWLEPVRRGASEITAEQLTRFTPPADGSARQGAVLMLFAEGERGGELLLTERAHDMRSHPGQVSFPGGSVDPGESVEEAALREADEEVGLDPASVELFGRLPELWLPPSNFAVTPVLGWCADVAVRIASRAEVHAIHRVAIEDLLDPTHRVQVRHPAGFTGPASSSAPSTTSCCGASRAVSSRGSSTTWAGPVRGTPRGCRTCPSTWWRARRGPGRGGCWTSRTAPRRTRTSRTP